MNKQIQETRFKVLFNNLLIESESHLILEPYYKKGLYFKVNVINNTQLNKHLIKI